MAKLSIVAGATSQSIDIFILDSTSTIGAGKTGLLFNTSGLTAYYSFTGANAGSVQIVLATLASVGAAYSSGGFIEIDATHMPGWYRLDLPNAALATSKGRSVALHLRGATGMADCPVEIELTGWDNQDAVRGGMSALPNANAAAAGGLIINGSNSGTVTLAALTVTGSFTISDGLLVSRSSSNTSAFTCTGNGTGSGAVFHSGGGATGDGFQAVAVSTTGNGFTTTGAGSGTGHKSTGGASGPGCLFGSGNTSGNGVTIISNGSTGDGLNISCNAGHGINTSGGTGGGNSGINAAATGGSAGNGMTLAGDGVGAGLKTTGGSGGNGLLSVGGSSSGDSILCTTTVGHGISLTPSGTSKHGINAVGAPAVSTNAAGNGANFAGGSATTGAGGTAGVGWNVVGGAGAASTNGAGNGGVLTGGGTTTVSGGSGLVATGTGTGSGLAALSGTGATGDGFHIVAQSTNGFGLSAVGNGTGSGIAGVAGGSAAAGIKASGVGGGSAIIAALIQGDLGGRVLGNTATAFSGVGAQVDVRQILGTASAGAAGYVGIDWANIANPTATVALTNTTISAGSNPTAAQIATAVWTDTTGSDFSVNGSPGKIIVTQLGGTFTTTSSSVFTTASLVNAPTGGSAPTVGQIATAVWQDATAGDFTAAGSIGKSLFTSGNAPGAASGLALVGSNMGTATSVTGNVGGNVNGNVVGSTGSIVGVTFPSHFSSLAIDVSGLVTFNNTTIGTATNLTNAPTNGDFTAAMKASLNAATPASIQSVTNIVSAGAITTSGGRVSEVALVDAVSQAGMNAAADSTLRRTMANVESSAFGDTVGMKSLYSAVQQLQASNTTATPNTLTVYRTDHSTILGTITLTSNVAAPPITGASVN